jgi:hypothetical protein
VHDVPLTGPPGLTTVATYSRAEPAGAASAAGAATVAVSRPAATADVASAARVRSRLRRVELGLCIVLPSFRAGALVVL